MYLIRPNANGILYSNVGFILTAYNIFYWFLNHFNPNGIRLTNNYYKTFFLRSRIPRKYDCLQQRYYHKKKKKINFNNYLGMQNEEHLCTSSFQKYNNHDPQSSITYNFLMFLQWSNRNFSRGRGPHRINCYYSKLNK